MTELDALKEQVELLKKLVDTQDQLIAEIKKQVVPTVWLGSAPCLHEYPNPWGATVPPHCKKCGRQAEPYYTITSSTC